MLHKILMAYDGTPSAEQAFEMALGVAQRFEVPLHVVAVASAVEVESHVMHDKLRRQFTASLDTLHVRCNAARVESEFEVTEGVPAWEIPAAADRVGADLIVIGHRQRSLMQRCLETSVAKRVLDRAHCAVLVATPDRTLRRLP